MTFIRALIILIQDRINHLEMLLKHYDDGEKDRVVEEIKGLETILDILIGFDD